MSKKYVVILESDTGYMDCVAICDNASEAYGKAYLAIVDGIKDGAYVTVPEHSRGDAGFVIKLKRKDDDKVLYWATILFYEPEGES